MNRETPLILVTNDDGVASPGLVAAAEALRDLGEVLMVAPKDQQTSTGRSYPRHASGAYSEHWLTVNGQPTRAYAVDGSPAQAVLIGLLKMAPRKPSLVVAGINYGENLGSSVTISGTVGACLEAAAAGIPSLAISLETAMEHHYNPVDGLNFEVAAHWTKYFADIILKRGLPAPVDILKVDVPASATWATPWRLTRLSRQRYYQAVEENGTGTRELRSVAYTVQVDFGSLEPDSDIYAFVVDGVVSVTPLTADLTARVNGTDLAAHLCQP